MDVNPNRQPASDPRVRVADLISDAREALAAPDSVIRAAGLGARARALETLLGDLADAAAAAIAEPVPAAHVMPGDVVLVDGSPVTVVSAPRPGLYEIGAVHAHGVAVDWRAGSQRGVIFRRAGDILCRLPRREGPRVITAVRPTSATGGGARPMPDDAS